MPDPAALVKKHAAELAKAAPADIIEAALKAHGQHIAIAFSGAEDVLLIEYAQQAKLPYRVFSLDTGRLHPETYRYFAAVEKHFGIKIEYCFPDRDAVQGLVRAKGLFSFYTDGHKECCDIRKVEPLRRQLGGLAAWITGQRRDQSPGTRSAVPRVQLDGTFTGMGGAPLVKYNPLADTSSRDVWDAIRALQLPINELHSKGYVSIGCEPCTRAILPGEHERAGRWPWEEATHKECGLHAGNLKPKG